jgi:hypothetical protein
MRQENDCETIAAASEPPRKQAMSPKFLSGNKRHSDLRHLAEAILMFHGCRSSGVRPMPT